jgi:hypothetical protein
MSAPLSRRKLGWLVTILLAGVGLAIITVSACNSSPSTPIDVKPPEEPQGPTGPPYFKEVAAESGLEASYQNGQEAGHLAILESLGGGITLIDYDGDGLLDIFVPGGGFYGGTDKKEIKGHPCKLFKNLGGFKFKDVTKEVGLDGPAFYTHGALAFDYDNDGWPDLLVTGWMKLTLYHNESDGKGGRHFVDVTKKVGLPEGLWTTSACAADFDGDGYADLYLCQYVDWGFTPPLKNPPCSYGGPPDVCPPKSFFGLQHKVFRNNGGQSFTDVTKEAGIAPGGENTSKGLGCMAADFDLDGKPDVYVANDTVDNFLYLNISTPGKIRFTEVGLQSGTARDERGAPNGSMGITIGDPDACLRPSILVTNYENEMHAYYHNECIDGKKYFTFKTPASGIARIGQVYVGWGTCFVDLDHHGWEDLVIINGHAIRFPQGQSKRAQVPVLFRNIGKGKFEVDTRRGGTYFSNVHVGRGAAFGDLDNDGRVDFVVSHINEPVALLHNVAEVGANHWIGFRLVGKDHRDIVGAKIVVEFGDEKRSRYAYSGGSYASSNDPRQVFGLGKADKITKITISWPNGPGQPGGHTQEWGSLDVDRYWRLVEGEKQAQDMKTP